eukprot:GSA25T00024188001.1
MAGGDGERESSTSRGAGDLQVSGRDQAELLRLTAPEEKLYQEQAPPRSFSRQISAQQRGPEIHFIINPKNKRREDRHMERVGLRRHRTTRREEGRDVKRSVRKVDRDTHLPLDGGEPKDGPRRGPRREATMSSRSRPVYLPLGPTLRRARRPDRETMRQIARFKHAFFNFLLEKS